MKKLLAVLISVFLLAMCGLTLTACGEDELKTFEYATFKSQTYMYDGLEKSIEVDGVPNGTTVTYDPINKQAEVGVYEITATIEKEGYESKTLSATLTIVKTDKYTMEEINALLAELTGALDSAKTETETLIGQIQTEYTAKINALIEELNADKTALETLEKTYKDKVANIEATASANKTELENKLASDKAELNADIEALEKAYLEKVAELEATASANKTELENKLASDKAELGADIEALEKEYKDKVAELEATASANKTELENKLASDKAELNANIEALEKEYKDKVAELEATASANKTELENKLASDKAELNADIEALEKEYKDKVSELEATASANKTELENKLASDKAELNADIEALEKEYKDKVAELEATASANKTELENKLASDKAELNANIDALEKEYKDKVAELEATASANKTELENKLASDKAELNANIEALEKEYKDKVAELEATASANKTELENKLASDKAEFNANIEALEKAYLDKVAELEATASANKEALEKQLASDKAELGANIEALEKEYKDKVAELEATASANKTELENKLASDKAELNADIEALEKEYKDKVAELEATASANKTELENKLASDKAELNANIEALEKEYKDKVAELEATASANKEALENKLASDKAELNANIKALESQIASVEAEMNDKIADLTSNVTALENRIKELEDKLNSEHKHTFGEWVIYGDDDANCEQKLFYRICSDCNVIEWKHGTYNDHDFETVTIAPTCQAQGYDHKTCSACGFEEDVNFVAIVDHKFETEYRVDNSYHWFKCENCAQTKDMAEHTQGEDGYCTVCDKPVGATDGIIYDLSMDETYAEVIGYEGSATRVNIADTYQEKPVKKIYESAFLNKNIVSVKIPSTIDEIGVDGFKGCSSLKSVLIDDLGAWCNIKFANEYSNPLRLAGNLYLNNQLVEALTIPEEVTEIKDYAFYYFNSLTSLKLSQNVKSIGKYAFSACYNLKEVDFGENSTLESTAVASFQSCRALKKVTVPKSLKILGDNTFANCYLLESVSFEEDSALQSIGRYAFANGKVLKSVTFDKNCAVTAIPEYAFNYCAVLESVVLPTAITSIASNAFNGCDALFMEKNGMKFIKANEIDCYVLYDIVSKNYSSYTIPKETVMIFAEFSDCGRLSQIRFEEGSQLSTIRGTNFYGCTSLASIVIPASVATIERHSFSNCGTSSPLGKTVIYCEAQSQPSGWPYSWNGFNPVYWADEWRYIDGEPVSKDSDKYFTEGLVFALNSEASEYSVVYYEGLGDTVVNIPSIYKNLPVTSIGDNAFYDLSYDRYILGVNVPKSITSIGDYAFDNAGLNNITFEEGSKLDSIGARAFSRCSLSSIDIPDSVTSIGEYAFDSCNISTIIIPKSVKTIGACFLAYNGKNIKIYCEAESQPIGWDKSWSFEVDWDCEVYWASDWEYVDGVPTLTYTEGLVFTLNAEGTEYSVTDYKGHIDDVVIPATYKGLPVTSIGAKAFQSYITLTSVVIPQGITSIGDYAFGECNLLESVIIPASVTSAGEGLFFAGNYGLKIYCEAESCPEGWDDNWSWYDTYEDELKPSVLHYAVYWAGEWEYVDGVPTPN